MFRPRFTPVIVFFVWILILFLREFGVVSFGSGDTIKGWIVLTALAYVGLIWIDSRSHFRNKNMIWLYWAVSIYYVIFNLAILYDWYSITFWVNRAEHFLGGFLLAWAVYNLLRTYGWIRRMNLKRKAVFIVGLASFGGMMVEVIELASDALFGSQHVGPGLYDTSLDILMDLLGFAVFLAILFLFKRTSGH